MTKGCNRTAKKSNFGSLVRKRLSDITNSFPPPKSPIPEEMQLESSSAKEQIDNLLKENMALKKFLADKNKIIELSGAELRKMQINLRKLQLQNWNLAQSNSHILAELNLGKEKVKALQHDIMCKDALLQTKNLEQEGKKKMCSQTNCFQEGERAAGEHKFNNENKPHNANRRHPTKSKSLGHSTTSQQETIANKRRCLRRQSARFKSHQQEPVENLFEIEETKFSLDQPIDSPMHEDGPTPLGSSIGKQEKDEKYSPRFKVQESHRTSTGRPLRRTVGKVQSYKEVPLKTKMRRPE